MNPANRGRGLLVGHARYHIHLWRAGARDPRPDGLSDDRAVKGPCSGRLPSIGLSAWAGHGICPAAHREGPRSRAPGGCSGGAREGARGPPAFLRSAAGAEPEGQADRLGGSVPGGAPVAAAAPVAPADARDGAFQRLPRIMSLAGRQLQVTFFPDPVHVRYYCNNTVEETHSTASCPVFRPAPWRGARCCVIPACPAGVRCWPPSAWRRCSRWSCTYSITRWHSCQPRSALGGLDPVTIRGAPGPMPAQVNVIYMV